MKVADFIRMRVGASLGGPVTVVVSGASSYRARKAYFAAFDAAGFTAEMDDDAAVTSFNWQDEGIKWDVGWLQGAAEKSLIAAASLAGSR